MSTVSSADGTSIAYHRQGAGPPVILVGGALHDAQSAAPLAAALAPLMTAVSYDRRGRGASGDTPPYAVRREVEDLAALIGDLGGQACLFGFSSGAVLALEAAAAGLAVPKMVLFEPPFRLPAAPELPDGYQEHLAGLIGAGQRGEAVEYFMTRAVGLRAGAMSLLRQLPSWPGLEALAPTVVYDGLVMRGHRLPTARLAALSTPALVLDSTGSAPWMRAAARATAAALPGGIHRSLDGTFHLLTPPVLAPVLAGFLA
jgi:Alpha/beta hydrolase family